MSAGVYLWRSQRNINHLIGAFGSIWGIYIDLNVLHIYSIYIYIMCVHAHIYIYIYAYVYFGFVEFDIFGWVWIVLDFFLDVFFGLVFGFHLFQGLEKQCVFFRVLPYCFFQLDLKKTWIDGIDEEQYALCNLYSCIEISSTEGESVPYD